MILPEKEKRNPDLLTLKYGEDVNFCNGYNFLYVYSI